MKSIAECRNSIIFSITDTMACHGFWEIKWPAPLKRSDRTLAWHLQDLKIMFLGPHKFRDRRLFQSFSLSSSKWLMTPTRARGLKRTQRWNCLIKTFPLLTSWLGLHVCHRQPRTRPAGNMESHRTHRLSKQNERTMANERPKLSSKACFLKLSHCHCRANASTSILKTHKKTVSDIFLTTTIEVVLLTTVPGTITVTA